MFTFYILYSAKAHRYYYGYTSGSIEIRLRKHNSKHSGFTSRFKDWLIVYTETFDSAEAARRREKEIKSWKDRAMVEKLILGRASRS